jgi:hypothetical protein
LWYLLFNNSFAANIFEMKNFLLLILILSVFQSNAQFVNDSTIMGSSYRNDVYYNLETGSKDTARVRNWDLAFSMIKQIGDPFLAILANHSNGVFVRKHPRLDASQWAAFDTLGWKGWTELYNTDTSWTFGAFNRTAYAHPFYSWGVYTNSGEITGDSLYLIELKAPSIPGQPPAPSTFKKLYIVQKRSVTGVVNFDFIYANLDGSDSTFVSLKAADYDKRNFAYYSIRTKTELDREPDNDKWDLVFTRYWALQIPENVYYQVTGVLHNYGVQALKVSNTPINDATWSFESLNNNISTLGFDWKKINMQTFVWDIEDSLSFFIKSVSGDIWQLYFTRFTGQADGKTVFAKRKVSTVSIDENASNFRVNIYPNPTSGSLNIFTDAQKSGVREMNIFDINGRKVAQLILSIHAGLSLNSYDVSHLPKGIYFVSLLGENGNSRVVEKLIKH